MAEGSLEDTEANKRANAPQEPQEEVYKDPHSAQKDDRDIAEPDTHEEGTVNIASKKNLSVGLLAEEIEVISKVQMQTQKVCRVSSTGNLQAPFHINLEVEDKSHSGIRTCTIEDIKLLHEQHMLKRQEVEKIQSEQVMSDQSEEEEFTPVRGRKKRKKI